MSPRQVQVGGNSGVETVAGTGGYFGSVILPLLFAFLILSPTLFSPFARICCHGS
jgi:hypothetical protein